MIHANLAVTLRLRPITRQSSPNHVLTHTTTRAYAPANLPFNGKPETGSIPGHQYYKISDMRIELTCSARKGRCFTIKLIRWSVLPTVLPLFPPNGLNSISIVTI